MVFKYSLIKTRSYYSDKSYACIMSESRSVDVDSIEGSGYAEYLLEKQHA